MATPAPPISQRAAADLLKAAAARSLGAAQAAQDAAARLKAAQGPGGLPPAATGTPTAPQG